MTREDAIDAAVRAVASKCYATSWPLVAHALIVSPEKLPRTIAAIREEYDFLVNGAKVYRLRA